MVTSDLCRALMVTRKVDILTPLGALYYNTGRYEEALHVYKEAATLQSDSTDIWLALVKKKKNSHNPFFAYSYLPTYRIDTSVMCPRLRSWPWLGGAQRQRRWPWTSSPESPPVSNVTACSLPSTASVATTQRCVCVPLLSPQVSLGIRVECNSKIPANEETKLWIKVKIVIYLKVNYEF